MTRKERWQLLAKFTDWLFDDNNWDLPKEFEKVINHKMLISALFRTSPILLKHLNKYLNNFNVYSIPLNELALYIKKLIRQYGITRKQIWWFSNLELKTKLDRLPLIKQYEKDIMISWYKDGYLQDVDEVNIHYAKYKKQKVSSTASLGDNTMFISLKQKFSNKDNNQCKQCTLVNHPIVTFDTNSPNNYQNIDVLFVAEAPGETEVEKGTPLIGKAGQVFRQYLSQLNDFKWFITNTCLCRPPNNRKPTKEEITCCANKLDEIIKITKPKLIVALGSTPAARFTGDYNIAITKHRGQIIKYTLDNTKYDVLLTVHPSYILRNPYNSYMYEEDFSLIKDILYAKTLSSSKPTNKHSNDLMPVKQDIKEYYIHLDEDIYTDYNLVDIQYSGHHVLYVLRHRETNQLKVKEVPIGEYEYSFILKDSIGRHVLTPNEIQQAIANQTLFITKGLQKQIDDGFIYEGDISIETRHIIDYYYVLEKIKRLSNDYKPRVVYFDIEVDAPKFPKPEEAKYPVVLITAKFFLDDKIINKSYVLSNKKIKRSSDNEYLDILDTYDIKYFKSELSLIKQFFNDIKQYDVDILTAWNISFDIGYLYTRLLNLISSQDNPEKQVAKIISRLNYPVQIDFNRHYYDIPGYIILDLMTTYKFITYGNRESYSLDYITQYEGISSEGKKFKGAKFNELWIDRKDYALAYNMEDVELIYKLDRKLSLIDFVNEFRKVTKVSWKAYTSTSKTSDSLILYFAKSKGQLVRNKVSGQSGHGTKVGAYVYPVVPGIHWYMFEADFASLYPSIIETFNISPNTLYAEFKHGLQDVIDYLKDKDKQYVIIEDPIYNPTEKVLTLQQLKQYIKDNNLIVAFGGGLFTSHDKELSILADIISYLKERRKYYKNLYKETGEKKYDLFQLAYKIALNSLYGFLGFEGSRFMHVSLVNNVTLSGQIINKLSALTFHHAYKQLLDKIKNKEITL